jgi:rhamnose transport system ATP-binding protein
MSSDGASGQHVAADHGSPASPPGVPVLAIEHARKSFGAVHALVDASLELYAGEVHGLVGENGAGKSTLMKILAGVHQPDGGRMLLSGADTILRNPSASLEAGIAVIYQEPTLFPDLSVAENVFMGRQPRRTLRRIDRAAMGRQVREVLDRLGVRLDPWRATRGLSIADQQIIEIAKALTLDAKVIVMDEPTAALSSAEVERLFRVVEALRRDGAALVFISHRLDEVFAICQRITVMRDGRWVLTDRSENLTPDDLVRAMVGRDLVARAAASPAQLGETVLAVERLTREGVFVDISFEVRAGEIVALAGLVGAGRSEVARAIFGVDRYDAGSVTVAGRTLRKGSPSAAMEAGIGLVPEDRRQNGLVMDESLERNVALASLQRLRHLGVVPRRAARLFAADWAQRLQIKYGRLSDPVANLSGGNQQKVVLAKWLSRRPSVLIVDEPTRGIDVGTKAEVHRLLANLAAEGVAVLMISSELPEVLRLADRVLVIREGRLVAELSREEATEEAVIGAAAGLAAVAPA